MITAAQELVLAQVYEKLSEHFPGFVLVCRLHDDISHLEDYRISYYGGGYAALGLLVKGQMAMTTPQPNKEPGA